MILDKYGEFINDLAIPAEGNGVLLGDVIDLTDVRDIGNGQPVYWYVMLTEAAAGGTSLAFHLITADNAAMTTNATAVVQSPVIPVANLGEAGQLVMVALPIEGVAYRRYLGVHGFIVGTFTDGTLSSGLTLDPRGWKAYPSVTGVV